MRSFLLRSKCALENSHFDADFVYEEGEEGYRVPDQNARLNTYFDMVTVTVLVSVYAWLIVAFTCSHTVPGPSIFSVCQDKSRPEKIIR